MDVFTPKSGESRYPGVIFVHGGPLPESILPQGKDLGQLQSFGPFVTAAGLAGIVFSHGLSGVDAIQDAARDVDAAVRFVRLNAEDLRVDLDRLCIVFSSAGGIFLAPFLRDRPPWLKCVVLNYAVLRPGASKSREGCR
jgi:acetyl esterase/lipase